MRRTCVSLKKLQILMKLLYHNIINVQQFFFSIYLLIIFYNNLLYMTKLTNFINILVYIILCILWFITVSK